MDGPARTPPRFVPTLTAVVDLEEEAPAAAPPLAPSQPIEPVLEPEPAFETAAPSQGDVPTWASSPLMNLSLEVTEPLAFAQPSGQGGPFTAAAPDPAPEPAPALAIVAAPEPAVFVPQLRAEPTFLVAPEVSASAAPVESEPSPAAASFKALSRIDEADAFRLEEELLHRVLQRVDLSLEDRLTEVVSTAVQQQLDAMVPRLRQEVEAALRELVVEAMAHELSETPGSAAHSRTKLGLN